MWSWSPSSTSERLPFKHKDSAKELSIILEAFRAAHWQTFLQVREEFPSADAVDGYVVFNVRRNRYRLITAIHYAKELEGSQTEGHLLNGTLSQMLNHDSSKPSRDASSRRSPPHPYGRRAQAATRALFELTAKHRPTHEEMDAIELLSLLIERYEDARLRLPKASPVEVLRFFMEQHGLAPKDLVPEFGSVTTVSLVLSGKRQMTREHIARLSTRFHTSPCLVL